MTSFPAAISYAAKAVQSILSGSVLPDKLVLYLTLFQFTPDTPIPDDLLQLAKQNPIFEIRDYPDDIRSYRKLIPALHDFPEAVIVTVDDDVAYHPDMLQSLLEIHHRLPDDIIAHRAKTIRPDKPYRNWPKFRWYDFILKRLHRSPFTIQTGVGGVLYPPHSLQPDMIDASLFTAIAPTTDDIWFWAAAVAAGRCVIPVPFGPHNKPKSLGKPKALSLKTVNFKAGTDRNSAALAAIISHYPAIARTLHR